MKSRQYAVAVLPLVATVALGCFAEPDTTDLELLGQTEAAVTGNGAPSGAHYQCNMIGVPKNKQANMSGNNGSRMFVPLYGNTEIYLQEGTNFRVLDANGTDADGAKMEMPAQVPTHYDVWVRALGKPGGSSIATTCATDPTTGEEICSMSSVYVDRNKGKSTFNIANDLMQIQTTEGKVQLFDDRYEDYFWNWDNNGLKVAQLRFYSRW